MKVPNEKFPVYLISYLDQSKGDRTPEVPGTTVRRGRASKLAGPNTHEPRAGLESTAVVADPPFVRVRLPGSRAYNRSTYFRHRGNEEGRQGRSLLERGRSNLLEVGEAHTSDEAC